MDLDAITANLAHLRRCAPGAQVMAVTKADAYGHGAPRVARALEEAGVDWLGVAMVEEGAELRRAGVTTPILVLGPVTREQLPLLPQHQLMPAVSSIAQLAAWAEHCAATGRCQELQLEVDTGMGRLGIEREAMPRALELLRAQPLLRLRGLLSHLADSDELESGRNEEQITAFTAVLELLTDGERAGLLLHLANSSGALHWPGARLRLVRSGLALYGFDPARRDRGLRPAMAVRARVAQVREVPGGSRIGYNGRWRAAATSRIGVVQVGYADGYSWRLANRGEALVRGRRVPVAGAVSMDLLALDLSAVGGELGDEVVLLGRQGEEEIDAWELADRGGTVPYEVLTRFGQRLARRYLQGGRVVETSSRHLVHP